MCAVMLCKVPRLSRHSRYDAGTKRSLRALVNCGVESLSLESFKTSHRNSACIRPPFSIKHPQSIESISTDRPPAQSPIQFLSSCQNVQQNSIKARPPSNPPNPPFIVLYPSQPSSNQTSSINESHPRSSSEHRPGPGHQFNQFRGSC